MVSKFAIPYLEKAENPHILMNSPPLDMQARWFAPHTAYSMAKFGMSMVVLGLSGELRPKGIAVNALWPRATIATSAIQNLLGGDQVMRMSRKPEIMADAAYAIFNKKAADFTGHFLIDDTFLYGEGVRDFEQYRVDPSMPLAEVFFTPSEPPPPPGVVIDSQRDIRELEGITPEILTSPGHSAPHDNAADQPSRLSRSRHPARPSGAAGPAAGDRPRAGEREIRDPRARTGADGRA